MLKNGFVASEIKKKKERESISVICLILNTTEDSNIKKGTFI